MYTSEAWQLEQAKTDIFFFFTNFTFTITIKGDVLTFVAFPINLVFEILRILTTGLGSWINLTSHLDSGLVYLIIN